MATQRNPSFGLTDAQVDDIVDRLLRGKYEKHRPVESLEVVRAGFIGSATARDYVTARWGIRSSWSKDPKEGLSSAGITMRSNKLWERCSNHVARVKGGYVDAPDLVWRITDSRTYDTVCYATGSAQSAKQWAFTLFGWTLREGIRIEELRTELAGCGGDLAASIANISMLKSISARLEELELRIARAAADAEKLRLLHSTISSAAAHLAGGAGATAG
jgi:hypothetical protein